MDTYGHVWATINGSMDTRVLSSMGLWTSMDMSGLPLMGPWTSRCCHWWAVDIYGHVWATIDGSMDIWVLSLMGLRTSMDMFGPPLMGPWTPRCCHWWGCGHLWTCLGYHQWVHGHPGAVIDGLPLMGLWAQMVINGLWTKPRWLLMNYG